MAMEDKSLGLCFTCNSKEICTQRKGIKFPVLFCEEFENLTSYRTKVPVKLVLIPDMPEEDNSMGLCLNCSNRNSCMLRNSPGGIWHCEEYC